MPIFSPTEITDNYMKASVGKAESPAWRLFILAVAAGLLIGLGGVTSSTAAHALDNAGMVRLVSGLIFPVGLMMVILMGTELFTGNALMITAALDGRITWGRLLRNWGIVFAGNLVGAVALAACMAFFGQLNIGGGDLAVYTAMVGAAKSSMPWMNAFVLGVFCNLMVCIAVYQANTAQDTAGRILGIFFPIMGFVLAGFEHCVADMYYVPAGIFAYLNPAYTGMIDAAGVNTAVLTFGQFVTANLIPVTLGNIVGGVLVGLTMYACHRTKTKKD
ncbi:formate/nitrite transporter family protein [Enterorhabdus mucosicola]|uniref:Formate/nitrite transporter family protein n=1 Tax=Adlercreutzia mucosicola TaxID=580026 RepID=A0A6N8JNL3_9ACTN|nr:formate/nitrite transporter family protein [Adlercreutzia mucosicola]MVX60420.1 formate/nitrite transporter family protein [Adlercreutzia mucosicola]